ncbi:MAG: hypothetical protein ABIH03_00550 [Pseudomonadota bacterium]
MGKGFLEYLLGASFRPAQPGRIGIEYLVHRLRLLLAFDTHPIDETDIVCRGLFQVVEHVLADQQRHPIGLGQGLKARSEIDRIAYDRGFYSVRAAHCSRHRETRVQANPDTDRRDTRAPSCGIESA